MIILPVTRICRIVLGVLGALVLAWFALYAFPHVSRAGCGAAAADGCTIDSTGHGTCITGGGPPLVACKPSAGQVQVCQSHSPIPCGDTTCFGGTDQFCVSPCPVGFTYNPATDLCEPDGSGGPPPPPPSPEPLVGTITASPNPVALCGPGGTGSTTATARGTDWGKVFVSSPPSSGRVYLGDVPPSQNTNFFYAGISPSGALFQYTDVANNPVAQVLVTTTSCSPPACVSSAPQASITNATSGTFYAYAYGVTNADAVFFPTWGEANGQDDIVWYPGTNLGNGNWRASIDLANHKFGNAEYGTMNVHIYMSGNGYWPVWCGTANFTRDHDPIGNFDSANCTTLRGWVVDLDAPNTSINYHLYKDGPAGGGGVYVGSYSTQLPSAGYGESRADVNSALTTAYGIAVTGIHGFSMAVPIALKDGAAHQLYIYAINDNPQGVNTLIGSSPRTITCALPAPGVSLLANGVSNVTVSNQNPVTLSWTTSNAPSACSASGAWSGSKNINGSTESVIPNLGANVYTLTCSNAGGSNFSTATIQVNTPADLSTSNKDITAVNGSGVAYHPDDGMAEAAVGSISIAEGSTISFAIHVRNVGSSNIPGDFVVTDVLSNLLPPTGGWNIVDPMSKGYVYITCNNTTCGGHVLDAPVYNSVTKTAVFTIRAIGGQLGQNQFISIHYNAETQGPRTTTANLFRFLNRAQIAYTDPVNGPSVDDCTNLTVCPLISPAVLFYRALSMPFLREVQ